MAKSKTKPGAPLTKKQVSRRRKEQQQLRWIWLIVAGVGAIIAIILTIGIVTQSTRTVATVNGEPIKATTYEQRVRYYYYSYGPDIFEPGEDGSSNDMHELIVDQLVEETLIRQQAEKQGVSVPEDEIQIMIEENWFQHYRDPPTPYPTPTVDPEATATPEGTPPVPTATPDTQEAFESNYELFVDNVLKPARLKDDYLRQLAEVSLLRDKLAEVIVPEIPTEEDQILFRYTGAADGEAAAAKIAEFQAGTKEQVQARHILVETREEAESVLERLANGEDFAALAAELSTDPGNKDSGGDLGWFGRGDMVSAFEQAAFEGEIGLYPDPVETDFGFHVIEVLGHEDRPIDMDSELYEAGWYGKDQMAEQFGALFAEMLFSAEIGLYPDPIPTTFGTAIVEILDRQVRQLEEYERQNRQLEGLQLWLDQVREEGDIDVHWDASMIPTRF